MPVSFDSGEERTAAHFPAPFLRLALALFLLSSAPCSPGRAQTKPTSSPQTTYVYFQRTSRHARFSTPAVFDQVVGEFREYLSTSRIVALTENNVLSLGAELPLSAVQEMARDSGAPYLLYVIVDRPMSKWLKVSVQCYDASGRMIWQEEASAGGGLTSKNATRDTRQKLREKLNRRLGQPGLPLRASEQQAALTTLNSSQQSAPAGPTTNEHPAVVTAETQPSAAGDLATPGANVRLANGTPVHLLLTEPISSKSAQAGSTVKLQVLGDVKVADLVVIANKAPATATIEAAKGAGRAWHKGSLLLKLGTVTLLNQQQQPLRAWSAVQGKDTGAAAEWTNAVVQS